MKTLLSIVLMAIFTISSVTAQDEVLLYPQGPAENSGITVDESMQRSDFVINITEPRMYVYMAKDIKKSAPAVLICPGGGYSGVSVIKEGEEIARWFNERGIHAFVLYYRMPNGKHIIPLKDAQTAMDIMHQRAKEWKINRRQIGIMGFSAGGHLAATVGTHFVKKTHRPAFMILGYPVITMDSTLTHAGSRRNLIGSRPDDALVKLYSTELQVTKRTPPTFIVHAEDDRAVPIQQSYNFRDALLMNKVKVELHVFPKGGHGFGMRKTNPELDTWPSLLNDWLLKRKLIR